MGKMWLLASISALTLGIGATWFAHAGNVEMPGKLQFAAATSNGRHQEPVVDICGPNAGRSIGQSQRWALPWCSGTVTIPP